MQLYNVNQQRAKTKTTALQEKTLLAVKSVFAKKFCNNLM